MNYKTLVWLVIILIIMAGAVVFQIIKSGGYGGPQTEAVKLLI